MCGYGKRPGSGMDDRELKEAESREFGRRVREELARRRVSRQALADMAQDQPVDA